MVNFTDAITGGLGGYLAGNKMGGPIGGLAGGLIGGLGGLFGSKKKKKKKLSTFDKQQQRLNRLQHQGILGQGPLADMYKFDQEQANQVFNQNVADPTYRKFQEDVIPSITGQFRNQGMMQSSYAGDAMGRLARDVQQGLDAQRANYMYNQQNDMNRNRMNAIENIQGRTTFDYDTSAPSSGGFNINRILQSVTPDMIDDARNYFSRFNRGTNQQQQNPYGRSQNYYR